MKRISEYASEIEKALRALAVGEKKPEQLYAPIEYALEAGGKRLRPVLVLSGASAFGGLEAEKASVNAALAIELFHNYTLLHDDVMDQSDMRRNRPTVVKKYGVDTAILSGDAMLGLGYELLSGVPKDHYAEVMAVFNGMAMEVYEGQAMDMAFEDREDVSVEEYVEMISKKTGALLGASAEIGAIIGGATAEEALKLREYGVNLGIAFQIEDDWLDTFGDSTTFGKPIGGDINNGKKTYLLVAGQSKGGEESEALKTAMSLPAGDLRVRTVSRIMEKMGLSEMARNAAAQYSAKAMAAVKSTNLPEPGLETFKYLVDRLSGRKK